MGYVFFTKTKGVHTFLFIITACVALIATHQCFISTNNNACTTQDTIIVGTSPDFPPFEYISNGEMIGFEIDLIHKIGNQLHKKITIVTMPFETLLPALQLGKIQIIVAGLSATPERAKQVLFSSPYITNNPLVIVSLKTSPSNTLTDLNQKNVIVNTGYSADTYMAKIHGPIITRLKSPAEAFLALQSRRAHAFITAQNTLQPFFKLHGEHLFHIAPIPNTEDNTCLAIAPGHTLLHQQIQTALNTMKAEGSLQNLQEKWGL